MLSMDKFWCCCSESMTCSSIVLNFYDVVELSYICYVSFKLRGDKMSILEKVWGLCIVCCGCIGGIIGTIQAFQSIASKLLAGAPPG